jgi:soluble lytic murein transglycosylase-like protein
MRTFYYKEILAAAEKHQLDPILVEAVVVRESSGNADGFRFEKDFWNRYLKPNRLYSGRNPRRVSSSYGLMQVMFSTAVDRGFGVDLAPELLFLPENSLEYGCRHLRYLTDKMLAKYPSVSPYERTVAILASYNGGFQGPDALRPRNKEYALGVLQNYKTLLNEHGVRS